MSARKRRIADHALRNRLQVVVLKDVDRARFIRQCTRERCAVFSSVIGLVGQLRNSGLLAGMFER